MAMSVEDQGPHDLGFLWESQSWGLSNSDNSDETKEKLLDMAPPPPINKPIEEANNEGESLANSNKRNRAIRDGRRVMNGGEGKDGKCREADHELHIWTERERRKKMRNMFASLHALLPQLPSKADKSTIVDEAVSYIKSLQQTVDKLEKQKQERNQAVSPIGCESSVINSHWNPYDSSREVLIIADQGSSNNLAGAVGGAASNPSNSFSSTPRQPAAFKTWASPNVVLNIFGDEAQFCICATRKQGLFTTISFVLEKHKIDVISANILCNRNGNRYMILAHASKALLQFAEANAVEETFKRAAGEITVWLS